MLGSHAKNDGAQLSLHTLVNQTNLTRCFTRFKKNDNSMRQTKRDQDFIQPRLKTEFAKKSFAYQFVKCWNNLPLSIKSSKSYADFDVSTRKLLISKRSDQFMYSDTRIIN